MVHEMLNQMHAIISGMSGTTDFMEHKLAFHMQRDMTQASNLHHKMIKVHDSDIAPLVDALLDDPAVNSWLIPDFLERPMYMSMLRLLFTVSLDALGTMRADWMGYTMQLTHVDGAVNIPAFKEGGFKTESVIDAAALERLIDALLEDKSTNQPLIPDFIERRIYRNMYQLMLMFFEGA